MIDRISMAPARVLGILPMLAFLGTLSPTAAVGQQEAAFSGTLLAKAAGQGARVYGLYQMEVGPPSLASRLRYHLYTKPGTGPEVNRMVFLAQLDQDGQPDLDQVSWMDYYNVRSNVMPRLAYSADFAFDENRGAFFVVSVRSLSRRSTVQVHQVAADQALLPNPSSLDPEQMEEWPGLPDPSGKRELELDDPPGCAVSRTRLVLDRERLLIHGLTELAGCRGFLLSYSLNDGSWTKLRVEDDNEDPQNASNSSPEARSGGQNRQQR